MPSRWARCRGRPGGRSPRRGGPHLALLAVDAVAVELDAPRRGRRSPLGARRRCGPDAVAVQVDARLDGVALTSRCSRRGRQAGRAARRGGAHLAVRAVDAVAVERRAGRALTRRRSPRGARRRSVEVGPMPWPSSWPRASTGGAHLAVLAVDAMASSWTCASTGRRRRGPGRRCCGRRAGRPPRRGGAGRWPRGARRRCRRRRYRDRRAGRAPRRGGAHLAVLPVDAGAVDAVAAELDARLDAVALASRCLPSRWPRCRGRRAGRPPRRGGAHLAVLAVDAVASS